MPVSPSSGSWKKPRPIPIAFTPPRASRAATPERAKFIAAATKRVSWADEEGVPKLVSSWSAEDGTPTDNLKRSIKLLESLYDLRRVGQEDTTDSPRGNSPRESDEDMVKNMLRELGDNEAQLKSLEVLLADGQDKASEHGEARHATAVLSGRTLAVVRRKMTLLHDVEARSAQFEAMQARCEEILPKIVDGSMIPPIELAGVPRFISRYTHSPGNPADANKSDFQSFVTSFRLPNGHFTLRRLRLIAEEAGEWWAEACLAQAAKGVGHVALRRLFDVAVGTGVDVTHPKLIRAEKILIDRLAERVLKEAQERQQKDAAVAAKQGDRMQVGPAAIAADKIEQLILQGIEEGVPKADPRLKEAEKIVKALREADGQRKRLVARQKRLDAEAKA